MSARVRIVKNTGVQFLERRRGFRSGLGYTVDFRWKGTEAECGLALDLLVNEGSIEEGTIEHDSGNYFILTASYAAKSAVDSGTEPLGAESVVTTWSRESVLGEKTLWNRPEMKLALAVFTDTTQGSVLTSAASKRAEFRAKTESFWRGELTLAEYTAYKTGTYMQQSGVTANMLSDIRSMLDAFASGTEAYRIDVFQIRRIQIGPPANLINNDATNNKVWSRATLISDPTMPNEFKNVVPAGFFLQSAAQIAVIEKNRWQVTQTWDHSDEFNTWLYGAPI